MKIEQIKEIYWIDFLQWYKDYDRKDYDVDGNTFQNTHVLQPLDDLFWYWLVCIKADSDDDKSNFIERLRENNHA